MEDDRRRRRPYVFGVHVPRGSWGDEWGRHETSRFTTRLIIGLFMMVVGLLWLFDNLGMIDAGPLIKWWPIAFVILGLIRLLGLDGRRHVVWGGILLVVGLWVLGENFGYLHQSVWALWPLVLVVVGGSVLWRATHPPSPAGAFPGAAVPPSGGEPGGAVPPRAAAPEDRGERLNVFSVWSSVERRPTSSAFRGGEVSAIMGAAEIDLRAATPPPEGCVIDLFVWMGGVELLASPEWRVVNEVTAVMGAVEDERRAPAADATKTVRLRGLVLMGGVEIKG